MKHKKIRRGKSKYHPKKSTKYAQVGKSNKARDRTRRAKSPGWRRTAWGTWYFENRRNRSDQYRWL